MVGGDMGNLMCHHPSQLCFLVRSYEKTSVHVQKSTGERKGIDFLRVKDLNRKRHLGIRMAYYVLPNSVDVLGDDRISKLRVVRLDHTRVVAANPDFLLHRIPITHSPTTDFAGANSLYVIFGGDVLPLLIFTSLRGSGLIVLRCHLKAREQAHANQSKEPFLVFHMQAH